MRAAQLAVDAAWSFPDVSLFNLAFPSDHQPDRYRVAALGQKFDSPIHLLRGVLNAAILARDPGREIVDADVGGMDLGPLPIMGDDGYSLGSPGERWRIERVTAGCRVLIVEVR